MMLHRRLALAQALIFMLSMLLLRSEVVDTAQRLAKKLSIDIEKDDAAQLDLIFAQSAGSKSQADLEIIHGSNNSTRSFLCYRLVSVCCRGRSARARSSLTHTLR